MRVSQDLLCKAKKKDTYADHHPLVLIPKAVWAVTSIRAQHRKERLAPLRCSQTATASPCTCHFANSPRVQTGKEDVAS